MDDPARDWTHDLPVTGQTYYHWGHWGGYRVIEQRIHEWCTMMIYLMSFWKTLHAVFTEMLVDMCHTPMYTESWQRHSEWCKSPQTICSVRQRGSFRDGLGWWPASKLVRSQSHFIHLIPLSIHEMCQNQGSSHSSDSPTNFCWNLLCSFVHNFA